MELPFLGDRFRRWRHSPLMVALNQPPPVYLSWWSIPSMDGLWYGSNIIYYHATPWSSSSPQKKSHGSAWFNYGARLQQLRHRWCKWRCRVPFQPLYLPVDFDSLSGTGRFFVKPLRFKGCHVSLGGVEGVPCICKCSGQHLLEMSAAAPVVGLAKLMSRCNTHGHALAVAYQVFLSIITCHLANRIMSAVTCVIHMFWINSNEVLSLKLLLLLRFWKFTSLDLKFGVVQAPQITLQCLRAH